MRRRPSRDHGVIENGITQRLLQARLILELGQHETAERIGIPRGTLTNYESGLTPVSLDLGIRFCERLQVNPVWLGLGGGLPFPLRSLEELRRKLPLGERFSTAIDLLSKTEHKL